MQHVCDSSQTKSNVQSMITRDEAGSFPTHAMIMKDDCVGDYDSQYIRAGPRPMVGGRGRGAGIPPPLEWGFSKHLVDRPRLEQLSDLPPDIVDRYERRQFLLKPGVFPEICRAWCVFDTDFFMWHAEDYAADFQAVTNISEVITAVALIRQPPGARRRRNHGFLLLLATPVEIHVMELEMDPDEAGGSLDNFRDPKYKVALQRGKIERVPTDNVTMGSIIGTPDGRIFMAGSDSAVYELLYGRAAQGWFTSSRTKYCKVNQTTSRLASLVPAVLSSLMESLSAFAAPPIHKLLYDRSRGILYAWGADEADRDIITIYRTTARGVDFQSQIRLPTRAVAVEVVEGTPYDVANDNAVRLVVVDNQGGRQVYVDCRSYHGVIKLRVNMVRGVGTGKRGIGQLDVGPAVDEATVSPGLSLMAAKKGESHVLVSLQPHLMHYTKESTKTAATAGINNIATALEEFAVHTLSTGDGELSGAFIWTMAPEPQRAEIEAAVPRYGGVNELAVQHRHRAEERRSVLLLTSLGTFRYEHKRPIDDLEALLAHNPHHEDVERFFSPISLASFGGQHDFNVDCSADKEMARYILYNLRNRREAVATALALACTDSAQRSDAVDAILKFAMRPRLLYEQGVGSAHHGEFVSSIYDGLCQYLGRVLRSHWNEPVCVVEDETSPVDRPTRISVRQYAKHRAGGGVRFRYRSRVLPEDGPGSLAQKINELEVFEQLFPAFYRVRPGLLSSTDVRKERDPGARDVQLQQEREIYKLHQYTRLIIEVFHLWLFITTDLGQDGFGVMSQFGGDKSSNGPHTDGHLRDTFFVATTLKDMIPAALFRCDSALAPSRMVLDTTAASPLHAWKLMITKMRLPGQDGDSQRRLLHKTCPTIYSKVDVLWDEAIKLVTQDALATNHPHDFLHKAGLKFAEYFEARADETPRQNWLKKDAMREGLEAVCQKFAGGDFGDGPVFIEGIVSLVHTCAEHARSRGYAVPSHRLVAAGASADDPVDYAYTQLIVQLEKLEAKAEEAGRTRSPQYPELQAQCSALVEHIIHLAKPDRTAHEKLFAYFLEKRRQPALVQLHSPFLEDFLEKRVRGEIDPALAYELEAWTTLLAFYEQRGRNREAAELCITAAQQMDTLQTGGVELTLADRRELIASARNNRDTYLHTVNVSMVQPTPGLWELLPELERRVEIQYSACQQLAEAGNAAAAAALNGRLLRKEELTKWVGEAQLHECILDLLLLGDPNAREGNQVNDACESIIHTFFAKYRDNMPRIMEEVVRVFRRHGQHNQLTAVIMRIVRQLEEHAFRHRDTNPNVLEVLTGLLKAGFPAHDLYIHGYKALVNVTDGSDTRSNPIMARYLTVICALCEEWQSPGGKDLGEHDLGKPPDTLREDIEEDFAIRVQCIAEHWATNDPVDGPLVSELDKRLSIIIDRAQHYAYPGY